MNNVWWAIINFFRKIFVPPELTSFERELVRQVSHLEGELHREREKYEELVQRLLFPANGPVIEQAGVNPTHTVSRHLPPARERARELSELSMQRWRDRADQIAREAEERLANRGEEETKPEAASQVL